MVTCRWIQTREAYRVSATSKERLERGVRQGTNYPRTECLLRTNKAGVYGAYLLRQVVREKRHLNTLRL